LEAEGISEFQRIVSKGISDSYLRWRGIEATLQLAQSSNSKIVIVGGGKEGVPIILNASPSPQPEKASATEETVVSVSVRIRLGSAVIYGELQLEVVFGVSQIDESETVEWEPLSHFQPKRLPVEIDGFLFVDDTDHTVQDFGHCELPEFMGVRARQKILFELYFDNFHRGGPDVFEAALFGWQRHEIVVPQHQGLVASRQFQPSNSSCHLHQRAQLLDWDCARCHRAHYKGCFSGRCYPPRGYKPAL
jgi:hypothetical protein